MRNGLFRQPAPWRARPALSGNIVSSIADGRVLNALGDQRANTLVGVYHMTWEPNSQWLFERVERTETSPPTT
jgi:hypothetical protein